MWSETYDRELTDIFAIQDEIAKEVVDVLQVTLLGAAPTVKETDTRAYALYLEGLHYLDLDRSETWAKAMELFEEALAIDPLYAPAWFGKARAMREMANWGDTDLDEGTELARQWASHATELDPSLSEAWALLSHISLIYDWDWATAQELIDRALQEGPNNPGALGEAAMLEQTLGRLDRSIEYKQRALSLDPLSQVRITEAGVGYWWSQDYERAYELFSKNAELYPDDAWPGDIVATRIMQGRLDEVEQLINALADMPYEHNFVGAYAFQALGRAEEAAAATEWIIDFRGVPLAYQVAEMYAWQGNPDKAFEWLETGFETRDAGMSYLLVDLWLESLHGDSRWRPLLEKMSLLEYWDAMPDRQ